MLVKVIVSVRRVVRYRVVLREFYVEDIVELLGSNYFKKIFLFLVVIFWVIFEIILIIFFLRKNLFKIMLGYYGMIFEVFDLRCFF